MRLSMALVLLAVSAAAAPVSLYVSVDGNDGNPGTLEAPFASLHRAQQTVRESIAANSNDNIAVFIRGGVYYLEKALAFDASDSGGGDSIVTYRAYENETPVLSGGRIISGWQPEESNRWTTVLPEAASGAWRFRQLFRNEERLPRARFPKGDALLRVASVNDAVTEIELQELLPAPLAAEDHAELVVFQNWSITRVPVVSAEGTRVRVRHPAGWIGHGAMTTTSPGKPCYLENVPAFLSAPGEWHLNQNTGVLTYQAAPGEDPNAMRFTAPCLDVLIRITGEENAPVQNLHFEGITFAHAEWPLPEFGYIGIQAGHHGTSMTEPTYVLPGAVELTRATGCEFAHCRMLNTGASGIVLGAGCKNNSIRHCLLEDIGGSGIMVGWRGYAFPQRDTLVGDHSLSADWLSQELVPTDNTITDCTLRRCGAVNYGCVGIFDAFCDGTRILHNHVSDMPYTGISIGFRWDSAPTSQRNCIVEYNHVHDVMKKLADGGCIYTLGYQPGTVLRGNLLYDVHRSAYAHGGAPNNGIFFDEGSKGFRVEANIIHSTSGEAIRFNQTVPENLTFKNNFFNVPPEHPEYPADKIAKTGPR